MQIILNGEPHETGDAIAIPGLLGSLGLDTQPCAVEVNAHVVPRDRHPQCTLHEGDRVEIVTLVGGG